jgi:hypothetical protein
MLALGFGDENDIIKFEFTETFDDLFADLIQKFGSEFVR